MKVLYIGGYGRSGSTLLERLIGELPGVCSLGEVTELWALAERDDVRCGCGSWFATCDFWAEVGRRAFGGWAGVDLDRIAVLRRSVGRLRHVLRRIGPRLPDSLLAAVTEYADYHARLYAAAAAVTGAQVVVDSSKDPGLVFSLRWARDLDLRLLHLVRDPRGVAFSWAKRVADPARDGGTGIRRSPLASAVQWAGVNAALELLPALGPRARGPARPAAPSCRIRYEDLTGDPAGTIRAVAGFAGLRLPDGGIPHLRGQSADLGIIHSAGGNRMRFVRGPVALRRDDAWRTALPARHRVLVGALCLPLIAAYGYPVIARAPVAGRAPRRSS